MLAGRGERLSTCHFARIWTDTRQGTKVDYMTTTNYIFQCAECCEVYPVSKQGTRTDTDGNIYLSIPEPACDCVGRFIEDAGGKA